MSLMLSKEKTQMLDLGLRDGDPGVLREDYGRIAGGAII